MAADPNRPRYGPDATPRLKRGDRAFCLYRAATCRDRVDGGKAAPAAVPGAGRPRRRVAHDLNVPASPATIAATPRMTITTT